MNDEDLLAVVRAWRRGELPRAEQDRLTKAMAGARRALAARQAARLLDPLDARSRWSVACEIAERLAEFESEGRAPRSSLERELELMVTAPRCPRSPERLSKLLL